MGWLVNTMRRPFYPGKKNRYLLYTRLGRPQGPECGKSRPTGTRSPDCPARSKLLYRLSELLYRTKRQSVSISISKKSISKKCHSVIIPRSNNMSQHQYCYIQTNVTVPTLLYQTKCNSVKCHHFYIKQTSRCKHFNFLGEDCFNSVEFGGLILAFQTSMLPR
jgi:hypothetical protein